METKGTVKTTLGFRKPETPAWGFVWAGGYSGAWLWGLGFCGIL